MILENVTLGAHGDPVSERSKSIVLWDLAIFSLRRGTEQNQVEDLWIGSKSTGRS